MNIESLSRILKIGLLLVLQVLIFNQINLFHIATPYPYIVLLFLFPLSLSPTKRVIYSGLLALLLDAFSGTKGLHTASFTLIAFLSIYLQRPFIDMDSDPKASFFRASSKKGILFLLFLEIILHHFVFFFLDGLSLFDIHYFLLRFLSSSLLSILVALLFALFMGDRLKRN